MTNVDMVRLAGSRQRLSEHPTVDPVTAEVIRGGMEPGCFAMASYVSRTATRPDAAKPSTKLTEAVARYLFTLQAYKGEYDVARLQ